MLHLLLHYRQCIVVLQLVLHQNMVFQALDFMMAHTTMVDTTMGMSEFETNLSQKIQIVSI